MTDSSRLGTGTQAVLVLRPHRQKPSKSQQWKLDMHRDALQLIPYSDQENTGLVNGVGVSQHARCLILLKLITIRFLFAGVSFGVYSWHGCEFHGGHFIAKTRSRPCQRSIRHTHSGRRSQHIKKCRLTGTGSMMLLDESTMR
nr:hypothetical protein CFP56_04181 [Quercus suber]